MSNPEEREESLVAWARKNLARLRHEPSAEVADELGDHLLRVDAHLGVEVADNNADAREVILTAFSEPSLFPLVRRISELLSDVPGWRFVALKPPRGFAFTVSVGEHRVDAKTFEFAPILGIDAAIRLFAPPRVSDSLLEESGEELAWLVVETGIGEELAGLLQHVELSGWDGSADRRPITELGAYVEAEWARH